MGMQGYLVTITSQQEHDYVYTMIGENCWTGATCLNAYTGPVKDIYKDFYAQKGITIPGNTEPSYAYYFWVCGPEKGKLVSYGLTTSRTAAPDPSPDPANDYSNIIYNNWASGEPNNAGSGEQCMHFFDSQQGRWNDFDKNNTACTAYVIEYGGLESEDEVEDPNGGGTGDVNVNVDVFVKVDIDIDPSGKTITTEAYDTVYGSPLDIRDNVNGDSTITTTDVTSGEKTPAEVGHAYFVYDPESPDARPDGYRPATADDLDRNGDVYKVGKYKVLTSATYSVQLDGTKVPYLSKEAAFQVKPLPYSPKPQDPEVGKPIEYDEPDTVPVYDPGKGTVEPKPVVKTYYEPDPDDPDKWVPVPLEKVDPKTGEPIHAGDYKVRVDPPEGGEGAFVPVEKEFTIDPKPIDLSDLVVDDPYEPDPSVAEIDDDTNPADVPFIYKKVYDGTTDYNTSKVNVNGFLLPGAGVSISCVGGEFDSAEVGATRRITLTGVELEGVWKDDYTIKGLENGEVTVPAVIVPRTLVVTPRASVTVGKTGVPMTDGLGKLVNFLSNEDVHDDPALPWAENMLAKPDAERQAAGLDSILGDPTYTCLRDTDKLPLDPKSPKAGVYTLSVHFAYFNPVVEDGAKTPAEDDVKGDVDAQAVEQDETAVPSGDDVTVEAVTDQTVYLDDVAEAAPVPAQTAVTSASSVVGAATTAPTADEEAAPSESEDKDAPATESDDADGDDAPAIVTPAVAHCSTFKAAPLYFGGSVLARQASWTETEGKDAQKNYTIKVRETKVIVSDDPSDPKEQQKIKEELEKQGATLLEGTYSRVADKKAEPVGPGTLTDLIGRTFPGQLPEGTVPTVLITKGGETVSQVDPGTPGTYTVLATYQPADPGTPPTVVTLTYTVEKPAPTHVVVVDETGTLPGGDGPFGPKHFIDEVEKNHGDKVPEGAEPTVVITRDGDPVDGVDPKVPGTYVVEVTYTDPDGNETVFRTTVVVPGPAKPTDEVIVVKPTLPTGTGPIGKDAIAKLVAEQFGDKVPQGITAQVRIVRDGMEVDAIDPSVPGTYEVTVTYVHPDGHKTVLRFTHVVPGAQAATALPTTGGSHTFLPATGDPGSVAAMVASAAVVAVAATVAVRRRRR